LFIAGLSFFLPRPSVFAQNINVASDDVAYQYLDLLQASGLGSPNFVTSKPLTRNDFADLVRTASTALSNRGQRQRTISLRAALDYLEHRFGRSAQSGSPHRYKPKLRLFDSVTLEYVDYNAPARPVAVDRIDAEIQPLTAGREGRTFLQGKNLALESTHWAALGDAVSIFYQGRLFFNDPKNSVRTGTDVDFETERLTLKFSKWNLDLLIGKDGIDWGPGARGNLMLSSNADPIGSFDTLPLFKLSNRHAIRLPWIFAGMGPMKFEVFVTRLAEDRADFSQPFFIGKRLTFRPSRTFEYGLSHTYILGGKNFPNSIGFFDVLSEFFFIRNKQDFFFNLGGNTSRVNDNIANHFMGVDFKLTLARLRGLQFYHEFYFDDFTFNLSTTVNRNLGYYGGVYLPRLTANGKFNLRAEFTHTPSIFYRGSRPLIAGFTYNRRILGNELGPFGDEVFAELGFLPDVATILNLGFDFQSRGLDNTANLVAPANEKRFVLSGRLTKRVIKQFWLSLDLRYQRIQSFAHADGDDRNTLLGSVSLRFFPHL